MSLTIVRMNTASSHTSTVLLTLHPLSDDLLNHCLDVEHQHPPSFYLDRSGNGARKRNFRGVRPGELIDRYVLNVANVVDTYAEPAVIVVDQKYQPLGAVEPLSAEHRPTIDNRH